jgi:hypothetical protein
MPWIHHLEGLGQE